MNRKLIRTIVGFNRVRYKVRLTGDPCAIGSQDSLVKQSSMMKAIADQPELLMCGLARFETLSIRHNGSAWEAEATAEVEEETEGR